MNGLTFSVSIPVFSKSKQRQAISEASENLIAAEKARDERLNQSRLEIRQLYLAASTAEKLMHLYTKGVIPQASLALESAMASYQTGKIGIQPVIDNIVTMLNYETDYYRQLADYQTALARMKRLTDTDSATDADMQASLAQSAPKEK
jgi:outer membrane protein TolC